MNEIIQILPEWQRIRVGHERRLKELQNEVNQLIDAGLDVAENCISDLANGARELYELAQKKANESVGTFMLPAVRKKAIDENTQYLNAVIRDACSNIYALMALNSSNPLSSDAFTCKDGIVQISDEWFLAKQEEYTIRKTEDRAKALMLIKAVRTAIDNLNDFVKDNKSFGKGITSYGDGRRCLCYIGEYGDFNVEEHNLQYI